MKTIIIRTSLVLAIAAAFAISALNVLQVRQRIARLQTNLQAQTDARQRAENDLHKTQSELKTTAAALAQTRTALETATAEQQKALSDLAAQIGRVTKLESELQSTRIELGQARVDLAPFHTAGLSAAQVLHAKNELNRLETELAAALDEIRVLKSTVAMLDRGGSKQVRLPADLAGRVLVTDPKWQFVVLDVGAKAGMLKGGELLVSRAGKFVGRIRVIRVERNRAIGDVLPTSGPGEVLEGDQVIPAYPES